MQGTDLFLCPAVVPVLVGPLQVLLTILPGLIVALAGGVLALFKPSGMKNLVRLLWQQKIAVLLLGAIIGGTVFGYRAVWSGTQTGETGKTQQGSDWPMARFDLRRTGAEPGTASPTVAKLIWSHKQGNEGFLSSPAVVGNRVYVASATLGAFSKSGMIYCLDADTGVVVWANAPEGYRPTFSSPVVVGNYLVCGEGLHDTRDARIVCLDISDDKRGEIVWTFETKNHVECTPVVANGKVYVGAGDDGYYCLDLKPDANGQARVVWHLPAENYPDAETSLAVHDGKLYAGLGNNGQALCVIDAETGKELHREKMRYPVFAPPAIAEGKIYLGMGQGDYVKQGEGGEVRCLDLKTLRTEWTFPLPQTVLGAVSVKEDKLYFGCRDGHLYCLSRGGKQIARFNAHAPILTSLAVTDQAVYVVSETGLLFALDRHTLEPVFEFRLGSQPLFISSPVVARGHVYVGTHNDGFLCVGEPGPVRKEIPTWDYPLGGPGKAGNIDGSALPSMPTVWWQMYGEGGKDRLCTSTDLAALGKELFVVLDSPLRAVCIPAGMQQQIRPKPRWEVSLPRLMHAPLGPLVKGEKVFVLEDSSSVSIDRATGESETLFLTAEEAQLASNPSLSTRPRDANIRFIAP